MDLMQGLAVFHRVRVANKVCLQQHLFHFQGLPRLLPELGAVVFRGVQRLVVILADYESTQSLNSALEHYNLCRTSVLLVT